MTLAREILADDARLAVYLDGPDGAPAVVLASSLGTTAEMWRPQVAPLATRFRVIRYDMRGHGRSQVPPGPYTIARLGRDVLAILDALGLARAHVAGVSLGGMVGQWLGVHAGARLDRLVLANTSAYMGPPAAWDARIEAIAHGGMAAIADGIVARWFTPRFVASAPATVAALRARLLATPVAGYVACCEAIRDMDQRASVAAIAAPTLVIAGTADPATPPAAAADLVRSIPGARLVSLDAAHLSNLEQPEAFTGALVEHFA